MIDVKNDEIYFAKVRPTAKIPTKKLEDAGYDLYADFDDEFFVIEPGETKAVPTGIACAFSNRYYIQVEERGSTGKIGMKKSSGVMDSGYRGEYLIMTYNTNKVPLVISKIPSEELSDEFCIDGRCYQKNKVVIYPYSKAICQLVVHEVPVLKEQEISFEDLKTIASERGSGKFGSSNK